MKQAVQTLLIATCLTACGAIEQSDLSPRGADDRARADEDREIEPEAEPAGDVGFELTDDGLDVLRQYGLDLYTDDVLDLALGDVTVTPAGGAPIDMKGVAIQLHSEDRFYDNTLLYAWSCVDDAAGTVDYLLQFRAAGHAEPVAVPLDARSNFMLPTWVVFASAPDDANYFNEDGTLTLSVVDLDPTTADPTCDYGFAPATCFDGRIEGDIDLQTLAYDGFDVGYAAPDDRGVSTGAADFAVTFDVPVRRASFAR